ncbi:hypothetical protein NDU88_004672 [Pleurodeles waltl]|uniref:Uncharacterized protein n=1 Tax=Pleurodeles waltl TaxID=8319 RepID=A0AAV7WVS6_PLEWA|nr:hypothetical protein NDU88_004672 [Pleurodeles waltl]
MEGGDAVDQVVRGDGEAPLTRSFMEQLFGALRGDFATLKQEIAAEVKELKREVIKLGQLVDTLEQARDAREEELDCHRKELLTLQDKNQELQYQIEDLENRARRIKRQQLEDDIRNLEATHGQTGSLVMQRQIATLRKQLRALDSDRAEYALLRTKQKYYAGVIGRAAYWLTSSGCRLQDDGWRSSSYLMARRPAMRSTSLPSLGGSTPTSIQQSSLTRWGCRVI